MSIRALQPTSQTCSLLPLQICGLAYLPAGECCLHLGCSPQQCRNSSETPGIAWSREAQFGDSGLPPLLFLFLSLPHHPLVLRLAGMEHCQHLNLPISFMEPKSLLPSQQRQYMHCCREEPWELRQYPLLDPAPCPHLTDSTCHCTHMCTRVHTRTHPRLAVHAFRDLVLLG